MLLNASAASDFAAKLLQIQAIKLQPDKPFTWASGWYSPIYCDNRMTLSYPDIRKDIARWLQEIRAAYFADSAVIAGVATAGIAHGLLLAEADSLPFIYVRSDAKKHGMQNRIEGRLQPGDKVLVIEDLISTGGSSLQAVEALRQAGADVVGLAALFTYDFEHARKAFEQANCPFCTITNYPSVVQAALSKDLIQADQEALLNTWREDPENWGK
ncbi:MAG: orotate phosphoribosyltransferase [Chitinophagales bacterium]|nr:orotate phosphoribosyltransferase [Chitinophagales bacterium]HAE14301.1 orotate phosphoribosyltransferase [Bacteroidota bacterium]MCB9019194.1 orotate phosphoribosyltransferase [Chitinophagales bacterium]MCB9021791.1 orotate phosphoribosyltransferase [Chitinophagales bacterium]MCB9030958.1 orotate phosphoribosyltransferase [Chitinophagales bacterium]